MSQSSPDVHPATSSGARWTLRWQMFWLTSFAVLFGALRLAPTAAMPLVAALWLWLMVFVVAVNRRHVLALHVLWGMSSSAAVLGSVPLSAGRGWDTIAAFTSAAALLAAITTIAALTADDYLHPSPAAPVGPPSRNEAEATGP